MAEISKWKEFERHFKRSFKSGFKLYWSSMYGKVGLILIAMFAFMAIFAPWLTPYTPDFEAPTEDALRTYLYAFNSTDDIYGMVVGYTQLRTLSSEAGDWIILNHGNSLEGIFVQNPKKVGEPNALPWETKPLHFTLNIQDIPGIGANERIRDMAFLSPSTSDLQYHYSGLGQDPDWDGEIVFITQNHLVIYDIYNFKVPSYNRYIVIPLNYEPTWVTVDVTSSGDTFAPVVYSTTPGSIYIPTRYIAVGNSNNLDLYFYYYTYSNDSYMPPISLSIIHIFNQTYDQKIIYKPLLFHTDNAKLYDADVTRNQNVLVVPLENSTIFYKGFDIHTSTPLFITPGTLPVEPPSDIADRIVETVFNFRATARPTYYIASMDLGRNIIYTPAVVNGSAVLYGIDPLLGANGQVAINPLYTINLGQGFISAPPAIKYAGGNFTLYITKYTESTGQGALYRYKGTLADGFSIYRFNNKGKEEDFVPLDKEVINVDYVEQNSELFLLTKDMKLYLLDLHLYEQAGYVSVGEFSYYNNRTGEISKFPYPPGSELTEYFFMGGLTGSKYTPSAAAFDIFGIYYCNDTKTVGMVILKGESMLPLPPGKYISGNRYILGTDDKGHDIWTWLVYGSRVAFVVGILASFFSVMIGTLYGVYSGYKGGKTDTIMMRFVDIMLTLPGLPVLLILTSILGPSIWNIILVISVLGWSGIARVIRAQTLSLKNRPFVDAARVAGAGNARIMISHIFPNVVPFSFLYMTLGVAGAIISEASLSFLGLGDPKAISWGQMLYSIQTAGATMYAWWWLLPPGLAITLISLGFYLVGRAFDEILNPRLRKR